VRTKQVTAAGLADGAAGRRPSLVDFENARRAP